ncbi:hypothetical protein WSK_3163 [Novosphingobium sp. Rr 2-17]|uniref:hypothetical protein n=1 Tax=Novosphingobium sp. Rr 2-17 TaxID=555793 RepID=UPI0002698558|nr:hypothetical protein [Novosphingobium sp. Rr 2-17]EIZ78281.1 hypothetical protein WSK_3163 [Novosphingobium sp. Rr 2-17]
MADKTPAKKRAAKRVSSAPRDWRKAFLNALAATSNVTASAKAAEITTSRAYEARRVDPRFYRQWQEALCEGYDHLELSLLQRLREGEVKSAPGVKRGVRVFDNAIAFRLLVAHREAAARQRAVIENRNSEAILDSINAKIEKMRERSLALAASEHTSSQDNDADAAR